MKKKVLFLLVVCICAALLACSAEKTNSILLDEDGVRVSIIEPTDNYSDIDYEWIPLTEELAFSGNDIIATGTVRNPREIKVEYSYMDSDVESFFTVFDFEISRMIFASDSVKVNTANRSKTVDSIVVGVPFNSHNTVKDSPNITDGAEFMLMCRSTSDMTLQNETHKLSSIVDYWCSAPNYLMLERSEGNYIANSFFANYLSGDCVSRLINDQGEQNKTSAAASAISAIKSRKGYPASDIDALLENTVLIETNSLEDAISKTVSKLKKGE